MDFRIYPPENIIEAEVQVPLSKSMSNRALLMRALTPGPQAPLQVASCADTDVMDSALSGSPMGEVNVGPAGTAMRFLTAYYAAHEGSNVTITGTERMLRRPIGGLVDALRQCGADIEYAREEGYPPLRIKGRRLHGTEIDIDASVSSQFTSALLMVAPTFSSSLTLNLKGEISSLPYLDMTIAMMRSRGIDAERTHTQVTVQPGVYQALVQSDVEADWSAASYWYSIAALSAGWITIQGLKLPSLQGDSVTASLYEKLGVVTEYESGNAQLSASPEVFSRLDLDMSDTPDLVQTLVVTCGMLGVPFEFSGVRTLRLKETDRLEALRAEMKKLGITLEIEKGNVIKWDGKRQPIFEMPQIDTYDDHRMAMAFAPAALYIPGLVIKDCGTVKKSYPDFWTNLQKAGFELVDASLPIEKSEE